jgi:hypothetical protein
LPLTGSNATFDLLKTCMGNKRKIKDLKWKSKKKRF